MTLLEALDEKVKRHIDFNRRAWNLALWGHEWPPYKSPAQNGRRLPRRLKKIIASEEAAWRKLRRIAMRRHRRPKP